MNKRFDDFKAKVYEFTSNLAHKTGKLAMITKLTFEIKKHSLDIKVLKEKIGSYILTQIDNGNTTFTADDIEIRKNYDEIKKLDGLIDQKEKEIETLKEELKKQKHEQ